MQFTKRFFSPVLRDSTPRFVRPSVRRSVRRSVGPSVGPSHFTFSALMGFLALLLLPKCSTDLNYGPCPPARDWGSRISGLVLLQQVPLQSVSLTLSTENTADNAWKCDNRAPNGPSARPARRRRRAPQRHSRRPKRRRRIKESRSSNHGKGVTT